MSKRDEPRSSRLTGSLRDRMNASRHDFTLDLFTRKGEFWNAIDQLRTRWRVAPRGEIPEFSSAYHCPNSVIAFYVPTEWPAALAPSPLPDSWPPFWELVNVLPPDVIRIDPASLISVPHPAIEWYLDLKRLHDQYVPEQARLPPLPNRETAWTIFLSACILYTPPADQLLEFAEHPFPEFVVMATKEGTVPTSESVVPGTPWQFGSPVVYLDDVQEVRAAVEARHAETWEFLRAYVQEQHGLDLDALLDEADEASSGQLGVIWERWASRMRDLTKRAYIAVGPYTTRDDITDAFKVLKRGHPTPKKGRPHRDALTSVQAAVWHDQFCLTNQEIAERLGWKLSPRPGAAPYSERVREHVEEGRRLLAQKKHAP